MSIETIISLIGISSGLLSIIFYFQWMLYYSKKRAYTISDLFKDGVYKPFKLEIEKEKGITEQDEKRLNRKRIFFYLFFAFAFLIAFTANLPLIKGA